MLLAANLVAFLALLALLVWVAVERRSVVRFARAHVNRARGPLTQAHALAGAIHRAIPRLDDDPQFLNGALAPIGAAPTAVLHQGGCCSGICRLYILALDALAISAAQVTLYDKNGRAQHCLVEVRVGRVRQLIDPMFGFTYQACTGRPMSLASLQSGDAPRFIALPGSTTTAYPRNPDYAFDYRATKTANWTRSWQRRLVYRILFSAKLFDIDRLRLSPGLEWPHLILACGIAGVVVGMNCLAAVR